MNPACAWRRDRARRIAPHYAQHPKVVAVMIGGSVARGYADRYSDLELGVFWHEFPTPDEFRCLTERIGGERWELDPYNESEPVWYEEYEADNLKIDLRHMTLAKMDEVLSNVLERFNSDGELQAILSAIQCGIPLHGEPTLRSWQARMREYPEGLRRSMILNRLRLHSWQYAHMLAERGDFHLVGLGLNEAVSAMTGALLGLNRIYDPGMKWLDRTLPLLPLAPKDFANRVKTVFESHPRDAVHRVESLVEETFTLIELHRPELDLSEIKATFRYRRPIDEKTP